MTLFSQAKPRKFLKLKNALDCKGLKVNIRKKPTVGGLQEELFKIRIDHCGVCGRRLIANWCCAQNVKTRFMTGVRELKELRLSWHRVLFVQDLFKI